MSYNVSVSAHSETATNDEIVVAVQAAVDSIPGASYASVSGTTSEGTISLSLFPTPAAPAADPIADAG